jgi:small subunit ribosomal protein S21
LQVFVRDNNVDQALRILKKKMQREGVFREMKRRRFYEKPSAQTTREKSEAIRRARKLARKQAQREGLIADPRKKKLLAGRMGGRPGGPGARGAAPGAGPGAGGPGGDARRPPQRRF